MKPFAPRNFREYGWRLAGAVAVLLTVAGCTWIGISPRSTEGEREATAPQAGTIVLGAKTGSGTTGAKLGDPVTGPFRTGEKVTEWNGKRVNAGRSGRTTYIYRPDFLEGLVAGSQERTAAELRYEKGDWHITCGVETGPYRCRLRMVARSRQGGRTEAALRIRYTPEDNRFVVCAGALDGGAPAIRTRQTGEWRTGGADGCFRPEVSREILEELARTETFAYQYNSITWGDVTGWRSTFGLDVGLELMAWMEARRTGR